MPYNKKKQKCTQSDGDAGSYVLSYTTKKGKKRSACHTSKKKMQGQIAAIEAEADIIIGDVLKEGNSAATGFGNIDDWRAIDWNKYYINSFPKNTLVSLDQLWKADLGRGNFSTADIEEWYAKHNLTGQEKGTWVLQNLREFVFYIGTMNDASDPDAYLDEHWNDWIKWDFVDGKFSIFEASDPRYQAFPDTDDGDGGFIMIDKTSIELNELRNYIRILLSNYN